MSSIRDLPSYVKNAMASNKDNNSTDYIWHKFLLIARIPGKDHPIGMPYDEAHLSPMCVKNLKDVFDFINPRIEVELTNEYGSSKKYSVHYKYGNDSNPLQCFGLKYSILNLECCKTEKPEDETEKLKDFIDYSSFLLRLQVKIAALDRFQQWLPQHNQNFSGLSAALERHQDDIFSTIYSNKEYQAKQFLPAVIAENNSTSKPQNGTKAKECKQFLPAVIAENNSTSKPQNGTKVKECKQSETDDKVPLVLASIEAIPKGIINAPLGCDTLPDEMILPALKDYTKDNLCKSIESIMVRINSDQGRVEKYHENFAQNFWIHFNAINVMMDVCKTQNETNGTELIDRIQKERERLEKCYQDAIDEVLKQQRVVEKGIRTVKSFFDIAGEVLEGEVYLVNAQAAKDTWDKQFSEEKKDLALLEKELETINISKQETDDNPFFAKAMSGGYSIKLIDNIGSTQLPDVPAVIAIDSCLEGRDILQKWSEKAKASYTMLIANINPYYCKANDKKADYESIADMFSGRVYEDSNPQAKDPRGDPYHYTALAANQIKVREGLTATDQALFIPTSFALAGLVWRRHFSKDSGKPDKIFRQIFKFSKDRAYLESGCIIQPNKVTKSGAKVHFFYKDGGNPNYFGWFTTHGGGVLSTIFKNQHDPELTTPILSVIGTNILHRMFAYYIKLSDSPPTDQNALIDFGKKINKNLREKLTGTDKPFEKVGLDLEKTQVVDEEFKLVFSIQEKRFPSNFGVVIERKEEKTSSDEA